MYSRHRVAGYSIDHVIKFLFFLLVPVVILDIMISCFVIFSMRSQSIQSLQDTTSLYASQIDTAHISINRYLIRLLTENDDADTLLETQDKLEFFHPQNEFIIILIFFWNLLKKDIRFFYIIQRMNGCIVLQKFFRHLLRISSYC